MAKKPFLYPVLCFLGSYGLACVLLIGLFILTLFGTLEQGSIGLYQAQRKYFDSVLVYIGRVPVFPGGYTLMALLAVNMLFGALIRRTSFGLYLVHGGVILLLAGGMVTHHFADEGRMILEPGKYASSFESNHEWEFILTDVTSPRAGMEYIIYDTEFPSLNDHRVFTANPWPFELKLSEYMRNAEPRMNPDKNSSPVALVRLPDEKENEMNVPALRVTVTEKEKGSRDGYVWGLERAPWVFESGGRRWQAHLRRRQYPLFFQLKLEKFIHEVHPGTQIPAVYQSDITLNDGLSTTPVSIKMNEPLRHRGHTFFQSSYYESAPGETASVLAVVRNPLERLPLWSTVIITLGLTLHFGRRLSGHLRARSAVTAALVLLTYICTGAHASAAPDPEALFTRENVRRFGSLPIQSEGRVKPIATFARFKLIQLSGRSTLKGESATRWLMRVLFLPDLAQNDKIFLIENPRLMQALGLPDSSPRARFSFKEIPNEKLFELAKTAAELPDSERTLLNRQTINLYANVAEYQELARSLNVTLRSGPQPHILTVVPPGSAEEAEWSSPAEMFEQNAGGRALSHTELVISDGFLDLHVQVNNPAQFTADLKRLADNSMSAARTRGDGLKLKLEVLYYRFDLFGKALALFILAFIGIALSWLAPRRKFLWRASLVVMTAALVLVTIAIILRCVIRGRPPVTNLYETTLFVPAVAAAIALGAECFDRRRIAAGLGALLGALGLFIANRYELRDGSDTMGSLVAVLNSNFWLATHVTTIAIGYSAGLLAGALAHIYIIALFMRRRVGADFFPRLAGMIYGIVCFALLFSLVGTVLGGIWANESWGRFWGWDPKENGALLIVLWCLAIIHARLGGYIRDFGIAASAITLAMVVVFSWWGVNLLGVGLHSYGFTSGILGWLVGYWILELGVIGIGVVAHFTRRSA